MRFRLSDNQIRILELLPYGGNDDVAPICCDISVVALSDKPIYEAVSYCWGSSDETIDIEVTGSRRSITTNLQAALRHLRLPDRKRSLWIDQLCVNQEDNEERMSQVHLMRDIYSHCTRCLVWLGEIDQEFSLTDAGAALDFILFLSDGDSKSTVPISISSADTSTFIRSMRALASAGCRLNPWWQRIWTVQESILPREKIIHWGPLEIPWERVTSALFPPPHKRQQAHQLLQKHKTTDYPFIDGYLCPQQAAMVWIQSAHSEGDSLIGTTMKWRGRRATLPQDKVFGLRGLFDSKVELLNTSSCNYETSAAVLYSAFTIDAILHGNDLEALIIEPRNDRGTGTKDVPNWAVDFNGSVKCGVDSFYRVWGYHQVYNACGENHLDRQALREAAAIPDSHFKVLGLRGTLIDTVKALAPSRIFQSAYTTPIPDFAVSKTLREWMDLVRSHNPSVAFNEEAFHRLVIGDAIRDEQQQFERWPSPDDLRQVADFAQHSTIDRQWLGERTLKTQISNQVFFVTQNGLMGLGHLETQVGDEVWVFDGGNFPFTIRAQEQENEHNYDFVGCCYLQGIMFGEAFADDKITPPSRILQIY